ncbi:MAG: type IX secretion system sortase PorU [Saprospiraceae bacterium]
MRIPLVISLCCLSIFVFGQTQSIEKTFVLPKGVKTQDLQWAIPLPFGKNAELINIAFAKTSIDGTSEQLSSDTEISSASAKTTFAGKKPHLYATFNVRRENDKTDLKLEVKLTYRTENSAGLEARSGPEEPNVSELSSGDIYKLSIDEDGIYQIDAAFISALGLSAANPQEVRLFSKGGAALPEHVGDPYPVDLQEVALHEIGDGDSSWEEGEKFLFYGQGEDVWQWSSRTETYARKENPYSEQTYYYIKVGGTGLRAPAMPAGPTASSYDQTYSNRVRWEQDLVNVLQFSNSRYGSGQGSGQQFFGYTFGTSREVTRDALWDLGSIVPGATGKLTARVAASSVSAGTRFSVSINGQSATSSAIQKATRSDANNPMAFDQTLLSDINLTSNIIDVSVSYPGSLESNPGWLDYVQLEYPCNLELSSSPLFFRSKAHSLEGSYGFEISNASSAHVLDITDPLNQKSVTLTSNRFSYAQESTSAPREFVAFDPSNGYPAPVNVGKVENSNLHALTRVDMLIVYGEGLESSAARLAEHRRSYSGFAVEIASMTQIAEEFGGGRFDPTAIRSLAKMIFDRDPNFRYIALLGDGTYDPRNIVERGGNLVSTYQTSAYNHEVTAFPADDYYVLLSDGDGRDDKSYPDGLVDMAIGRIPANTATQANALIDKIIRYDADPDMLGEWRMRNVYVADDEDSDSHFKDMDGIAEANAQRFSELNQVKIYADAFEQVPTPGGIRIPRAAEAINQNMFRGNLTTSYLGHGGPRGWAQERILNAPDIEKWNTRNSFPILITATCTFTGFDNPQKTVAGEQVLFKRDGGAVASFSTTRPVYTTANKTLTDSTHVHLFDKALTAELGIGELLNLSKIATSGNVQNNLKYSLFGDPAMKIAVPRLNVSLTHFDSTLISSTTDTFSIAPLQEVSIQGIVTELDGTTVNSFNGEVIITIFDKDRSLQTLGQDGGSSVRSYRAQGGTLFKGRATVTNGKWIAKFRLPKDMSISRGLGRLSMYAFSPDGSDGGGLFERFLVDGLATTSIVDDSPPIVEVFMGNDAFVSGALTSEAPVILAKLSDDFGINVSGTSIGHDLSATLRGGQNGNFVLNDFYQASADDYRSGEVRYPLFDLPEGEYELEVRAWDLSNNTGLGVTQFVVSNDAGVALRRVLNYPNPFVDATCFQFEHTAAGQFVEIQVDIYTTSGRLVRSLREEGVAKGFRYGNDDCISWDGTDMFGQELARGVYLYKIKLRTEDAQRSGESGFERLVVLK